MEHADEVLVAAAAGASRGSGRLEPGIPASWYYDPAVLDEEIERIFADAWQVVGAAVNLPAPGDRIVGRIGRTPLVVVRDVGGRLRGFVNVCRHRGHAVAEHLGSGAHLRCGYHGWTYGLDGRLRAAPHVADVGCAGDDLSLLPVAVDEWRGFVWANLAAGAEPLRARHPELDGVATSLELDTSSYSFAKRDIADLDVNWKLWIESVLECYHCPHVHPKSLADAFDFGPDRLELVNGGAVTALSARGSDSSRGFPGATNRFRALFVFPSSLIIFDDVSLLVGSMQPVTPAVTRAVSDNFFATECDPEVLVEWLQLYERTTAEDIEVVSRQQEAVASGAVPRGYVVRPAEDGVAQFHQHLRSALGQA